MDKVKVQKIRFRGLDFILTDPDSPNSPVATIEQFQKGECSYAHLYRDTGHIIRFHEQVGTIEDIEFGEIIEVDMDFEEFTRGICESETWPI